MNDYYDSHQLKSINSSNSATSVTESTNNMTIEVNDDYWTQFDKQLDAKTKDMED